MVSENNGRIVSTLSDLSTATHSVVLYTENPVQTALLLLGIAHILHTETRCEKMLRDKMKAKFDSLNLKSYHLWNHKRLHVTKAHKQAV